MHCEPMQNALPYAMQWYLHRVTILRKKVLVAMEENSRYVMLFSGMTKVDFQQFPLLFEKRLVGEVLSICKTAEQDFPMMMELIAGITQKQHFQKGANRSVASHIRQTVDQFNWTASEHVGRLPESEEENFAAGLELNQTLRKVGKQKSYFIPLEVFRNHWQERAKNKALTDNKCAENQKTNNIIPFPKREKKKR